MGLNNPPGTTMSGTCQILPIGSTAGIGADATTGERGLLIKLVNRTGGASIKGTLVSCSTAADKEAILQANEYDTIGVVQQAGIAEGSEMWVWINGSVAQVLYKNTVAATRGNILLAADTDGRAIDAANPGSGLPAVEVHFKECVTSWNQKMLVRMCSFWQPCTSIRL